LTEGGEGPKPIGGLKECRSSRHRKASGEAKTNKGAGTILKKKEGICVTLSLLAERRKTKWGEPAARSISHKPEGQGPSIKNIQSRDGEKKRIQNKKGKQPCTTMAGIKRRKGKIHTRRGPRLRASRGHPSKPPEKECESTSETRGSRATSEITNSNDIGVTQRTPQRLAGNPWTTLEEKEKEDC